MSLATLKIQMEVFCFLMVFYMVWLLIQEVVMVLFLQFLFLAEVKQMLLIFQVPAGAYTGSVPKGSLYLSSGGRLYGMTSAGGLYSDGNIFGVNTDDSQYTDMLDFTGSTGSVIGGIPYGDLTFLNGELYGMTSEATIPNSNGTIFSFSPLIDSITPVPSCGGLLTGTLVASSSGGNGSITYQWSDVNSTIGTSLNAVAGMYTLTATDNNGFIATTSASLLTPPSLQFGYYIL